MTLEFNTAFGKKETIETLEPKKIPKGAVEKLMNFFNQPGYNPITEKEATELVLSIREELALGQQETEDKIIKMQENNPISENEVMDLGNNK